MSPSNFIQTSQGVNFLPKKQVDSIYSGFAQYEVPIVRYRLTLTAGTKLEHNNFSGFDYQPSVRLLWTPTEHQKFLDRRDAGGADTFAGGPGMCSAFSISPALTEGPHGGYWVYVEIQGDPKLKAEQLIAYEAGYRTQVRKNLYLDFTAFYNSYSDLQAYGPAWLGENNRKAPTACAFVPLSSLPYANVIKGHTVGAEVAPTWKIKPGCQIRASHNCLAYVTERRPGVHGCRQFA